MFYIEQLVLNAILPKYCIFAFVEMVTQQLLKIIYIMHLLSAVRLEKPPEVGIRQISYTLNRTKSSRQESQLSNFKIRR
jgi:hypothetical protein